MTWLRRGAMFATSVLLASSKLGAQRVTVHGVVYDSLHDTRLAGAFVAIVGTTRSTTSDAKGNFVFDTVAPGTYQFTMQHDVLEAIGMSDVTVRATISDGKQPVGISVPSFAAIWRVACGNYPAPPDLGIIFGTVRGFDRGKPKSGAVVTSVWVDSGPDPLDRTKVSQRRRHLDANTDVNGGYALCAVPLTPPLQVRASADSAVSGLIDIEPLDKDRVRRRDLTLGIPRSVDSTMHGVVVGQVIGDNGPVANARVHADDVPEVRSGVDGRFVLRNVAAGSQQIAVTAIGFTRTTSVAEVVAHDTVRIIVHVGKVTALDSVRITAANTARQRLVTQFMDRRRVGIGYFKDSTQIARSNTLANVFGDMPVTIRKVSPLTLSCTGGANATIIIDRARADPDELATLRPSDIAAIELYRSHDPLPLDFSYLRVGGCVAIIWTKRGWP